MGNLGIVFLALVALFFGGCSLRVFSATITDCVIKYDPELCSLGQLSLSAFAVVPFILSVSMGWWGYQNLNPDFNLKKEKVRDLIKARRSAGTFPLDREEAEGICDGYFEREGEQWLRSVAQLMGWEFLKTKDYYAKPLPELLATDEAGDNP